MRPLKHTNPPESQLFTAINLYSFTAKIFTVLSEVGARAQPGINGINNVLSYQILWTNVAPQAFILSATFVHLYSKNLREDKSYWLYHLIQLNGRALMLIGNIWHLCSTWNLHINPERLMKDNKNSRFCSEKKKCQIHERLISSNTVIFSLRKHWRSSIKARPHARVIMNSKWELFLGCVRPLRRLLSWHLEKQSTCGKLSKYHRI